MTKLDIDPAATPAEDMVPEQVTETIETMPDPEATGSPDSDDLAKPVDDLTPGNREAAKYRRQARDAEAARDTLAAQLTAARQTIVAASFKGMSADMTVTALEAGGHPVDSFFDEAGKLNTESLTAASNEVADKFGMRHRLHIPNEGNSPSNTNTDDAWQGAFKKNA